MIKEICNNKSLFPWLGSELQGCLNNHNYVYYIRWCNGILYACIDIVIMVSPVCHTPSQSASIIHSNIVQLHAVTLHYDTPLTDSSRNIWCGLHFNQ